jgi:hypothetical protein
MYLSKLIRQDFCLGRGKGNADNCNFICISHYIPNLELLCSVACSLTSNSEAVMLASKNII